MSFKNIRPQDVDLENLDDSLDDCFHSFYENDDRKRRQMAQNRKLGGCTPGVDRGRKNNKRTKTFKQEN